MAGGWWGWVAVMDHCLKILSTALGLNCFLLPSPHSSLRGSFVFLRLANRAAVLRWALFWLLLDSGSDLDLGWDHHAFLGFATKSFWAWRECSERKHPPGVLMVLMSLPILP